MNNITKIEWHLTDYCSARCSYCPTVLWGGPKPRESKDYRDKMQVILDHYTNMGRKIEIVFNGGEPLEADIVPLIKMCKEYDAHVTLHTNGGKLWMDWWAIEPYVDNLILTYHYWQNPKLIRYILDTFINKNKKFTIGVPIRPNHFDDDIARALEIEIDYKIVVGKNALYNDARPEGGIFPYSNTQLDIMTGTKHLVEVKHKFENTTWQERRDEQIHTSPAYQGKICNVGIERLYIWHNGYATGSRCNINTLGFIWKEGWVPPSQPVTCVYSSCVFPDDQLITKFP